MQINPFDLDLEELKNLYKTRPNHEGVGIALAVKYRKANDSASALKVLEELEKQGVTGFSIDYEFGMALSELERFEEAKKRLYSAISTDPDFSTVYYNLANLECMDNNDEAAMKLIDKALEIEPDNPYCLFGKGDLLTRQEKYEEANRYLQAALDDPGVRPDALEKLAWNALVTDDLNKAIQYAQQLREIEYGTAASAFIIGLVARERKEWDIAVEWFEEAIEEEGEIAVLCYPMAEAENERGNVDAAIEWCLKAIKSDPTHDEVPLLLAHLYEKKRDVSSAIKWLEFGLEHHPEDAEAREMLVRLRHSN